MPHTQGPHTTPDHSSYQQPLEDSVMYIDDSVSGSHGGKDATAGGLEHAVLDIAKKGHGRPYVRSPRALHQRGLDCQTYTLMNGVLGIGGAAYLKEKNIPDLVDDIRKKAKHGRVPRAELMMTKVDAYFPEVGIPLKPMRITANLGNITQHLFKENRFLGLIEDIGYAQTIPHATAIIPLQNPTEKKFAVQMDSLTGTNNTLSLDDYLRIFKNFDPLHHNMIVYELE